MTDEQAIIAFLKDKPLYIEILRILQKKPGITVTDISKDLDRSLSTINTPLRQMEDAQILVSEKKGRVRTYRPKDKYILLSVLNSNIIENSFRDSMQRLSTGSIYAWQEFENIISKKIAENFNVERKNVIQTPMGKYEPDLVVSDQKNRKVIIEFKFLLNSKNYRNSIQDIIGRLEVLKKFETFDAAVLVFLFSKEIPVDKWALVNYAESLSSNDVKVAAILDTISSNDVTNQSFIDDLAQRICNRIERAFNLSEIVKKRANGRCELCNKEAPFLDSSGKPFLEIHHIQWLSQGGKDSIENMIALCPNCHRKMHMLNLKKDREFLCQKTKG